MPNLCRAGQKRATSINTKQSGNTQVVTAKNKFFAFFSKTKDVPNLEIAAKRGIIIPNNMRGKVCSWTFLETQKAATKLLDPQFGVGNKYFISTLARETKEENQTKQQYVQDMCIINLAKVSGLELRLMKYCLKRIFLVEVLISGVDQLHLQDPHDL